MATEPMTRNTRVRLLGPLPEVVPPAPAVLSDLDCGSFTRRTIEFSVEPGERIRAFLCLPHDRTRAVPGIYCAHQHGGNRLLGKSEVVGLSGDPNQAYARELAERGYVTLAPDAICFEDRCLDKDSPDYDHVNQLHTRLIRGRTREKGARR